MSSLNILLKEGKDSSVSAIKDDTKWKIKHFSSDTFLSETIYLAGHVFAGCIFLLVEDYRKN